MDATMHLMAREVRRAVMSEPTASVTDAIETLRRPRRSIGAWISSLTTTPARRSASASA